MKYVRVRSVKVIVCSEEYDIDWEEFPSLPAGNFVINVALIYFFGTKFGSREFLLECIYRFISNLYVLFLSNLVIGSVRPLVYERIANPRVRGGSTHLKNIKFFRCVDWWWNTLLLCNMGDEVRWVAIGFQCGVTRLNLSISPCFRIG